MSEPSANSFIKQLERSGIVEENRLKDELAAISKKANGRSVGTSDLVNHLIGSGLITKWHTEKLLAGKSKGFFLGKFKLLGHLGSGGMSSVYLARHRISEQLRAIKVLPRKKVADKSYLDRFYLEARAAASLNHPNVVRIYDICNEGITHYMVMEYVEGSDLSDVVKESGPLSFEQAVRYTIEAAIGLSHAHQRKLVHRDIKPANLLRTTDGKIKILDLGLALVSQDDKDSLTVLYNEKVMGTADYLSPEQAVNSHTVDLRTDIYSLGCTLYFFLTGHPPFPTGTLAQRIAMHQTQAPAPISVDRPDCPQELIDVCCRMMEKQADDRYQNCEELKTALDEILKHGFSSVPPVGEPERSPEPGNGNAQGISAKDIKVGSRPQNAAFKIETVTGKSDRTAKSGPPPEPRRALKAPPKWALPVAIVGLFVILVSVLSIILIYFR